MGCRLWAVNVVAVCMAQAAYTFGMLQYIHERQIIHGEFGLTWQAQQANCAREDVGRNACLESSIGKPHPAPILRFDRTAGMGRWPLGYFCYRSRGGSPSQEHTPNIKTTGKQRLAAPRGTATELSR